MKFHEILTKTECDNSKNWKLTNSKNWKLTRNPFFLRQSNKMKNKKKNRSLGQIKEIPCGCSRGHISCSIDMKINQMFVLMKLP